MADGDHMSGAEVRAAMERLLAGTRSVAVLALDDRAQIVDLPDSLPASAQPVRDVDAALDLFVSADLPEVLRIWREATSPDVGAAAGVVHPTTDPERELMIYFGDFRSTHGVLLAIVDLEELSVPELLPEPEAVEAARPRMCVFRQSPRGPLLDIDEMGTALLGWTTDEVADRYLMDFVHPDDQRALLKGSLAVRGGRRSAPVRFRARRTDGSWLWMETTYLDRLDDPDDPHLALELIDISREVAAVEALQDRERLLSRLAAGLPVGIFQVDREGQVSYSNDRLHAILGADPTDRLAPLLGAVGHRHRDAFEGALAEVLDRGTDRELELDLLDPTTGVFRHCHARLQALRDGDGAITAAIVCLTDTTEAVLLRKELEDRATFDALTRCYNRAAVMHVLEDALARPEHARTAAVFVDIDNFKPINDRLGHAAGDELLVALAERLRSAVRGSDVVGRLGGDEFLVVCPEADGEGGTDAIVERIRTVLAEPVPLGGEAVTVTSSIGVAATDGPIDADDLVRRADVAMYESKRQGQGLPHRYGEDGTEPPPVVEAAPGDGAGPHP